MDELAILLGHERRLLELLLFRLVVGKHLLTAGEARFLPQAAAEVESATERVREAELRRSLLVARLADELDVPDKALTLVALAEDAAEPYRTVFADHLRGFLDLVAEIEQLARHNHGLAVDGSRQVTRLLSMVERAPEAGPTRGAA